MIRRNFLLLIERCVASSLLVLLAGCSTGTNEYVRVMPTEGQSIHQLYSQTRKIVEGWKEFSSFGNCNDENNHSSYVEYRLRHELFSLYRGVSIVVWVEPKNRWVYLTYKHEEKQGEMPIEQQRLFDQIIYRLNKEYGENNVVKLNLADNKSIDSMLVSEINSNEAKYKYICTYIEQA